PPPRGGRHGCAGRRRARRARAPPRRAQAPPPFRRPGSAPRRPRRREAPMRRARRSRPRARGRPPPRPPRWPVSAVRSFAVSPQDDAGEETEAEGGKQTGKPAAVLAALVLGNGAHLPDAPRGPHRPGDGGVGKPVGLGPERVEPPSRERAQRFGQGGHVGAEPDHLALPPPLALRCPSLVLHSPSAPDPLWCGNTPAGHAPP